jgi:NSS family neurotransmitter:Na+ symporter
MSAAAPAREFWSSRLGFVLAASGSAVGLGSIWKFPYIAGVNGGGLFVVVYLACIALVAVPIMVAEILLGRETRKAPVGAFRDAAGGSRAWSGVGWMGVVTGAIILSYYSVVAGWTLHYAWLGASGALRSADPGAVATLFARVHADPGVNLFWHAVFMAVVTLCVAGGVRKGVERWNRLLMPTLILLMCVLLARATTLDGFGRAVEFVFGLHARDLTARGLLEALGHAFFTLSLGMGAMITYGSYVARDEDIVSSSVIVSGLDTLISLLACLVVFPITFSFGLAPGAGPGLMFANLPIAFAQMPGGALWAAAFFLLLAVAALASAISTLEVVVAHAIDELGWSRRRATLLLAGGIALLGVPSALSGGAGLFGAGFADLTAGLFGAGEGKNWFDFWDWVCANLLLPAGGLGIALFVAWRMGPAARERAFAQGSGWVRWYWLWLWLLRWLVPLAIVAIFVNALGVV